MATQKRGIKNNESITKNGWKQKKQAIQKIDQKAKKRKPHEKKMKGIIENEETNHKNVSKLKLDTKKHRTNVQYSMHMYESNSQNKRKKKYNNKQTFLLYRSKNKMSEERENEMGEEGVSIRNIPQAFFLAEREEVKKRRESK